MTTYVTWAYDWEGRTLNIDDRKVKVTKQLTEVEDDVLGQRHAFTEAQRISDGARLLLKIRYDLNPARFPLINYVAENKRVAARHVHFEMNLMDLLYEKGYGPKRLVTFKYTQAGFLPYPEGGLWFTIMTPVPGKNVDEIKEELSYQQRLSIRDQLTAILRLMGEHDRVLLEQDPSFLRYDIENDKLYLVDITHWGFMVLQDKITKDSEFVTAFGILTQQELDDEARAEARAQEPDPGPVRPENVRPTLYK